MSDLHRYIERRKRRDPEFADEFEAGYSHFKVGVLLKQAREAIGMTKDEAARKLKTRRSAVSRIENHAEEARLSTIQRYAKVLGKTIRVEIVG
jgi:DNA-binding XRE family transcriptional regulator